MECDGVYAMVEAWMTLKPKPRKTPKDAPAAWVETELGTLELGDPRLDVRVKMVLEACAGQPEASLPKACESRAATKGAHRLLDNSKVISCQDPRGPPRGGY